MRVAVRVATGTRDSVDAHDFDGTVRHLRLRCHVEQEKLTIAEVASASHPAAYSSINIVGFLSSS